MQQAIKLRSIVYVDGFNLYYGALKGSRNKWLNLERYFRLIRPHDDLVAVRYFTALIAGPDVVLQSEYLRALATQPLIEIILGRFKAKRVQCRVGPCAFRGDRMFPAQEEKHTDVNIGVRLLDDAYQNLCDRFIVVSGDSDLVPALRMVKTRFPEKELVVYVPSKNPTRGAAVEMRASADKHRDLPLGAIEKAQFPNSLSDGGGGTITKPSSW